MACGILRERCGHVGHAAYGFQIAVLPSHGALVLAALRAVVACDDGHEVGRVGREVGVSAHDFLHFPFPFHLHGLVCLAPAVAHEASTEVAFLQESHVYEGHSAQIERQEKQVARHGEVRTCGKIE